MTATCYPEFMSATEAPQKTRTGRKYMLAYFCMAFASYWTVVVLLGLGVPMLVVIAAVLCGGGLCLWRAVVLYQRDAKRQHREAAVVGRMD